MVSRQPHLPLSLAAKQLLCIVKQFTLPIDPFLHREDVVFDATISRWWKTVSYRLLGQNAYIWDIYTILKEVDLECLLFLPDASCGCVCWYSNSSQTIFTSRGCEMHFNKWYRAYHTNMSRLSNNHNIEIINRCYATSRPSTTAGLFGWCSRRYLLCVFYIQLLNQVLFSCATCTSQASTTSGPRLHSSTRRHNSLAPSSPSRPIALIGCFPSRFHPKTRVSTELPQKKRIQSISSIPPRAVEVAAARDKQVCLAYIVPLIAKVQWFFVHALHVAPRRSVSNEARRIKKLMVDSLHFVHLLCIGSCFKTKSSSTITFFFPAFVAGMGCPKHR